MMRVQEVRTMGFIDVATHHQRCEQQLGQMTGYVFDQLMPPTTWNTMWWGCTQVGIMCKANIILIVHRLMLYHGNLAEFCL